MAKGNGPAHTIRIGFVKCTIWYNKQGDAGFYSVNISRSYKDNDDKWQDGDSFNHADLPVVAKLADMATEWIAAQ